MAQEKIAEAGQAVERLREALLADTALGIEQCAPALFEAERGLRQLAPMLAAANPAERADVGRELERLRKQLGSVQNLIAGGLQLHQGWARLLSAALNAAAYTASGGPAPLPSPSRLSIAG
jgi:hypothetical protein